MTSAPPASRFLEKLSVICAVLVLAVAAFFHVRYPIAGHDGDLWVHLTGARWIVEHHAVPWKAFYTFLPDRPEIDFYWLFQLAVWAIFKLAGYTGLVLVRTTMFLWIGVLVFAFLLRGAAPGVPRAWALVVGSVMLMVLTHRCRVLRPHLVDYSCIALMLYVLEMESHRRWAPWVLSGVALLWMNAHGIVYPELVAVCLSYAPERLWARRKSTAAPTAEEKHALLSTVLPLAAIFLTPIGLRLLTTPFASTKSGGVIVELAPFQVSSLFDLSMSGLVPTLETFPNVMLGLVGFAFVRAAIRRKLTLRDLLLLGAGAVLVTRGIRFVAELSLFSLPLLRRAAPDAREPSGAESPSWVWGRAAAAVAASVALPWVVFSGLLGDRPAWPFSRQRLPVGVAAFLQKNAPDAVVLNTPNLGGYLEWALPQGLISLDVDIPTVFSDDDLFMGLAWPRDREILRKYMGAYHPQFFAVPVEEKGFPAVAAAFPSLVPVFVDDTAVLYVDSSLRPAIAASWRFTGADPFALAAVPAERLAPAARSELRAELERMHAVDPGVGVVDDLAARLASADGDSATAAARVAELVDSYPNFGSAYRLRGDLLFARDPRGAIEAYRAAIARDGGDAYTWRQIRDCYARLGNFPASWKAGQAELGLFPLDADANELYQVGVVASQAGAREDARRLFTWAWLRTGPENPALRAKLAAILKLAPAPVATP
ncbi:MAG TPA: hypothetical protein VMV18_05530 [bacterium]|nr:hypothetical protein [bacterium]